MGSPLVDHAIAATRVSPRVSHWLVILTVPLFLITMLVVSMQNWSVAFAATESTVGNCTNAQDFTTIQDAVNAATPDTIINICPGTYSESVNLSWMNPIGNITLRKVPGQVGDVEISPVISAGITISPNQYFEGNITLEGLFLSTFDYGIDFGSYETDTRAVYGSVILSDVVSVDNGEDGAHINATGAVTVENSVFSGNESWGLYIEFAPDLLLDSSLTMDSPIVLDQPNVYIESVTANDNLEDGIYVHYPLNIEVYDTVANNNGIIGMIGFGGGSGIYIDQDYYAPFVCGVDAQIAAPFVQVEYVSANDNDGAWGIYVESDADVYIYDTEAINNPYDGVAVLAYNDCYYNEIELVNSLAMSNGWGFDLTSNSVDGVETAGVAPLFGGFRLVSGGDIYAYSSDDALAGGYANEAIANQDFGYCLQSDGYTEVFDSWAIDNLGDGFKYSYGYDCDMIYLTSLGGKKANAAYQSPEQFTGQSTEAVARTASEPTVGVQGEFYETLVISNASAINNGGVGFAVNDDSLVVTFTNISTLRNITGVDFGEANLMPAGFAALDDATVQGEGISGPTHIIDSLIQSNTNYGLVYGQLVYQPTAIQVISSITSTNFISSSIVCENGEGLGAFQYAALQAGSVDAQLILADHVLTVDARGNWWGDTTGPLADGNPNGLGDSIVVQVFNPAIAANTTDVPYAPWIDTIFDNAAPNPTLVGLPVNVDYRFGDAFLAYFLENGVGNPHEGPLFTLSTNNGVVDAPANKYIINALIESSVTPTTPGAMSIQLDGPCGLDSTQNVLVASPSIAVEKSPDAQGVAAGESATFTITVINSGDITLTNIAITDPIAPSCSFVAGSFDDLGVGANSTYTCTLGNVTNNLVNTVTAQGFASIDSAPAGNVVTDTDSVNVYVASFELSKTVYVDGFNELIGQNLFNPSACALASAITVPVSTTVKYCYTLTNTGDYTLSTHSLVDSHFPNAILSNFPHAVAPGATFSTVDAGVQVTKTLTLSTTNVATWTAEIAAPITGIGAEAVTASIPVVASTEATVTISPADLDQDNDGIPDTVEGSGDINTNGIPDFLDPAGPTNEPPTEQPGLPGSLYLPSLGNND